MPIAGVAVCSTLVEQPLDLPRLTALCERQLQQNARLRRVEITRMADHIRVRLIDDNQIVFPTANRLDQFIRHLMGRHFRLQIIGRDLR